ncbi:MAG: A24 family peptidase [Planctomycetia bacterium]|nr:MAG: A24 family peptidase [Planctomycetia bacterium]
MLIWLLGLAVGSFLNVVIYRLPAGLSISRPARSFCPICTRPIAWYDNIPVLGWLLLRGRCRQCRAPISAQYPIIEAATALVFVTIHHLLAGVGAQPGADGLHCPQHAVVAAAWLLLAAAMVACTAMDLLTYTVDTRVTDFAMFGGIALYLFHPADTFGSTPSAADGALSAAAVLMLLTSGGMLAATVWFAPHPTDDQPPTTAASPSSGPALAQPTPGAASNNKPTFAPVAVLSVVLLVGLSIWLIGEAMTAAPPTDPPPPAARSLPTGAPSDPSASDPRSPIPAPPLGVALLASLSAIFVLLAAAGGQSRESDESVHHAIEEERDGARRMVLRELVWLAPILAAGALGWLLVSHSTAIADPWRTALAWQPIDGFLPVRGLGAAAIGVIAATAAGWLLRIGFTLALGREAFGTGDIYILAAAGACAGWSIALSGLLLAVGLALAGWLVGSLLKKTAVIPFGPWLALGFLAALWLSRPIHAMGEVAADTVAFLAREDPAALWRVSLILLGGAVIAVVAARLMRRLTSPSR